MRSLWKLGAVLAGASLIVAACNSRKDDDDNDDNDNGGTGSSTGSSTGTSTGLATGSSTGTSTGSSGKGKYGLEKWDDDEQVDACQDELQVPEPFDVVLMFVVDVSASMEKKSNTGVTKWEATKTALQSVIKTLPRDVAMGILYYPNMDPQPEPHEDPTDDPSDCVNTDAMVPPKLMRSSQREALTDSLDNVIVLGGTPTYTAYTVGLQALQESDLVGNKYMVLLTDGEPTYGVGCVGNGTLLESNIKPEYITDTQNAIEEAWDVGASDIPIGTFVIGSPGSEQTVSGKDARPWLSEAAQLGGTAPVDCDNNGPAYCHFDLTDPDVDFAQGLNSALAQILGQVVACDYSPPEPPPGLDLDLSEVGIKFIDGNEDQYVVPNVQKADCGDGVQGWYWNGDKTKIRLCADTCTLVRSDAQAGIQVLYGCKSIIR